VSRFVLVVAGSLLLPSGDAYLVRVSTNTGGYEVMNYELVVVQDR
jgi:hypothetical protein